MPFRSLLSLAVLAAAAVGLASAQSCADVHYVFARGTNQPAGFGDVGIPFLAALRTALPTKSISTYAVNYAADALQTSAGPGATDMTRNVVSVAASCPNTVFVIGGYSQGATVTTIAVGIRTILGSGETIPTNLAPRIKAVVTFGNPLGLFRQTIASASPLYAAKSVDYCNRGDPVCGAGLNAGAHQTYPTTAVPQAATRTAALVLSSTRNLRGEGFHVVTEDKN